MQYYCIGMHYNMVSKKKSSVKIYGINIFHCKLPHPHAHLECVDYPRISTADAAIQVHNYCTHVSLLIAADTLFLVISLSCESTVQFNI